VLAQWAGAGGLDLNLRLQAAHDGVAQEKAEKVDSLSTVQGWKEERKLEGGSWIERREDDSLAVSSRVLTATTGSSRLR
jgi:hypothetical protein